MKNWLNRKKTTSAAAPVESSPEEAVQAWEELTTAADDLHAVDATALHTDPAANPRTLDERIAAADRVSRAALAEQAEQADDRLAAARRARRSASERDRRALDGATQRADRAAATLSAIDAYETSDNPASSSLALHEADPRLRRMLLAISVAGSAASALGIGAWTTGAWGWATGTATAVLAELILTVPVVALLQFQGMVRAHRHADWRASGDEDAQSVLSAMWVAAAVLLLTSVLLNVAGIALGGTGVLGAVGIAGAVVAMGAALASWGVSTVTRAVIRSNTALWRTEEWAERRAAMERTASGADIPDLTRPATGSGDGDEQKKEEEEGAAGGAGDVERLRAALAALADEHVAALAARGTGDLAAWLQGREPGAGGPAAAPGAPPEDGGGAARGHIDADQHEGPGPDAEGEGGRTGPTPTAAAATARRASGDATTRRVAEHLDAHPDASHAEVAEALGLSPSTVKRHRRRLDQQGEQ